MRFFGLIAALTTLSASLGAAPRVLVDSVHAHNALQAPDDAFSYHETYAMRRGFDWLRSQNAQIEEMTSGRLSSERLKNVGVLFLNLVSADLPPFYADEIRSVKAWIESGGALFVITDHSNCYFHAWKLAPLFEEFGLEVSTVTACDVAPHALGTGNGWISVTNFKPHPITSGLGALGIQTGGTTDTRFGLATTSPQSWGDEWSVKPYGEGSDPGFYGNWKRDANEKSGPLAVVSAKNLGKGRIVVVGDQNIFGDPCFDYLDNGKLWRQSFAWLSDDAQLGDETAYQKWRGPTIVAWETPHRAAWGNDSKNGFFNLFGQLSRELPLRAASQIEANDALVLLADDETVPPNLVAHLKAGKNVVVIESDGQGALFSALEKELGVAQMNEASGAREWNWPNSGQVLSLPVGTKWRNSEIAPPEKRPGETQQLRLKTLAEVLRGLVFTDEPEA